MQDRVVLDSSVMAALFFFRDSSSEKAADAIAEKDLITVDLAIAEVGNVAWKRVVHFEEDRELTDQALQRCIAFILEACDLIAARDLAKDAFRISVDDGIPFYDSLFLAASEREKAPLMTMDRRLCEKVKEKRDVRMI